MSSAFINENDLVRLGEEARLTEQAPRVPIEEPEENAGVSLIKVLARLLTERDAE